ncbi:sodium bile acid symporter family-domain-containing protein [Pelagophyceae sp. CCMP2097]|nr:sodium bile acid symporter family-domain-containing protein [Pelagophyceae sp. CCMP2097]|mmetsp:Transcript_18475/g.62322  ORF Transcript_18475/g.62322 Transcript_18475/m.62322 type:complete len:435 (-) Transcript_18475:28-1332(-)
MGDILGPLQTVLILIVNLIISFAAGCATRREDYLLALTKKQSIAIALSNQFIIRPATVYTIVHIFSLPDGAAVGFLLCSMAPGGNGSNLLEIIFSGNVELGIVMTLCSSITAMVMIPFDFYIFARQYTTDSFTLATMPWSDIISAVACVCVGACVGALVRYRNDRLGKLLEVRTAALGVVLLIAAVVFAVYSNAAALATISWRAWVAGMFPCPCALLISYVVARLSNLSIKDARTVAAEVGECNIGVAYAILLLLYKDEDARRPVFGGIVAYTVFNEFYIFSAAFYWRKYQPPHDARDYPKVARQTQPETDADDAAARQDQRDLAAIDFDAGRRPSIPTGGRTPTTGRTPTAGGRTPTAGKAQGRQRGDGSPRVGPLQGDAEAPPERRPERRPETVDDSPMARSFWDVLLHSQCSDIHVGDIAVADNRPPSPSA